MSVYLRAHSVTLELPLDQQHVDEGAQLTGFRATMGGTSRMYRSVLKNINFSAEEGDRIGLLGLNGAGKSTLLRVLNGAFEPTQGRIERKGSAQSLLNATLGFSEQASVMENVVLRGTAMGLRRRQLEAALPEILDFSGLTERAMHRLHTLSSGQRMRLGFAISTSVQPDILLMDEWIATGDAAFIKRAKDRMLRRFNNSSIVVLASHSTGLLHEMCNKAIVLDEGRMSFYGDMLDALHRYREIVARASKHDAVADADPILYGDMAGVVERIISGPAGVQVEGWATLGRGREVEAIRLEMADWSCSIVQFDRIDRRDVCAHIAKKGVFGFRAKAELGAGVDVAGIERLLRVRVGEKGGFGPPLPHAPKVLSYAS